MNPYARHPLKPWPGALGLVLCLTLSACAPVKKAGTAMESQKTAPEPPKVWSQSQWRQENPAAAVALDQKAARNTPADNSGLVILADASDDPAPHSTSPQADSWPKAFTLPAEAGQVPPAVRARQCWAHMYRHPRTEHRSTSVVLREASIASQSVPPVLEMQRRDVTTREAALTYKVSEPKFKPVQEQVKVSDEIRNLVVTPAVYEEREQPVMVESSRIVLKTCSHAGQRAASPNRQSRQQTQCALEQPAVYRTVKQKVLVTPESVREEIIPARYKTITKWVLVENGWAEPLQLPERTSGIPYQAVIAESAIEQKPVPAQTTQLTVKNHIGQPSLTWQQVLCEHDLTAPLVRDLQLRLNAQGQESLTPDGKLGNRTWKALQAYQLQHGLAHGFLSHETLQHLGMRPPATQAD